MSETLLGMYVFEMIFFRSQLKLQFQAVLHSSGFIPSLSGTNSFCLQSVGYTGTGNKLKQQWSNFRNSFTVLLFLRGYNILYHSEYFSITRSKIRDSNESGLKMTGKPFPGVAFSLCFLLSRVVRGFVWKWFTLSRLSHISSIYICFLREERDLYLKQSVHLFLETCRCVCVCVCVFLTPWPFLSYTPFSALTKKLWNLPEKEWFYALQSSFFTIFTFRTCLFACIYPFSYPCFKHTHCFLKGLKVMNYFF